MTKNSTKMTVSVGEQLTRLIHLAWVADVPLLLVGLHGIGKSESLRDAAARMQIGCVVRDLSLMEPPDLVGLPRFESGATVYAPPQFLPRAGNGLFLLEEINRAPRCMQAAALQLLTARQLNDYQLPAGYTPAASMNPDGDEYDVSVLDDALLSRFARVSVTPSVEQWSAWAMGKLDGEAELAAVRATLQPGMRAHASVVKFVQQQRGIFSARASNPRAWTYVGRAVAAFETVCSGDDDIQLLAALVNGLVGGEWTASFIRWYSGCPRPLTAHQIIDEFPQWEGTVRGWKQEGKLDLIESSVRALMRHIQAQAEYDAVAGSGPKRGNVEAFIGALPGDLARQLGDWLEQRGYAKLKVPARTALPRPSKSRIQP